MTERRATWAWAVPPTVFLGWLFVYPMATLFVRALGDGFDVGGHAATIRFTFAQAALSTVATLMAGLPLTAVLANYRFPGRDLVRALVTVPFVLPTVVVGAAFLALGAPQSLLTIIAAHVFYNLAVVVRTVGAVWARLERTPYEAARVLGAGRARAFAHTTLPALLPSLFSAAAIVFLFTFTSFGVVLMLGGLRYRTIEVDIYREAITFLDFPAAAALAVVQMIGVAAVMVLHSAVTRRQTALAAISERERLGLRMPWWGWAVVMGTVLPILAPPSVLFARSRAGWGFLFDPGRMAVTPTEAIGNSLGFVTVATTVAVVIGGMAAWTIAGRRGRAGVSLDLLLMLPLGTSAVTIGLGFLVALDRPIDLRRSWMLVPLAHALVATPFVVRTVVPALRSIRSDLAEAAATLGASPRRVWREIEVPLIARSLMIGAGLAAAVSLGEFGATSFLARPETTTVPTLVFRMLSRPGAVTYSAAMALAVILMLLTAGLVAVSDRGRIGEVGSF